MIRVLAGGLIALSLVACVVGGTLYLGWLCLTRRVVYRRLWYAGVLVIAWAACGAHYSTGLVRSTETSRRYGFPLPVSAWERRPDGRWVDYSASLSPVFAVGNFICWLGLPIPIVVLIVKRRHRPRGDEMRE